MEEEESSLLTVQYNTTCQDMAATALSDKDEWRRFKASMKGSRGNAAVLQHMQSEARRKCGVPNTSAPKRTGSGVLQRHLEREDRREDRRRHSDTTEKLKSEERQKSRPKLPKRSNSEASSSSKSKERRKPRSKPTIRDDREITAGLGLKPNTEIFHAELPSILSSSTSQLSRCNRPPRAPVSPRSKSDIQLPSDVGITKNRPKGFEDINEPDDADIIEGQNDQKSTSRSRPPRAPPSPKSEPKLSEYVNDTENVDKIEESTDQEPSDEQSWYRRGSIGDILGCRDEMLHQPKPRGEVRRKKFIQQAKPLSEPEDLLCDFGPRPPRPSTRSLSAPEPCQPSRSTTTPNPDAQRSAPPEVRRPPRPSVSSLLQEKAEARPSLTPSLISSFMSTSSSEKRPSVGSSSSLEYAFSAVMSAFDDETPTKGELLEDFGAPRQLRKRSSFTMADTYTYLFGSNTNSEMTARSAEDDKQKIIFQSRAA